MSGIHERAVIPSEEITWKSKLLLRNSIFSEKLHAWLSSFGNNLKVCLAALSFNSSPYHDCIMRTASFFLFALLACTSLAYRGYTEPLTISTTCAPCSSVEHCASSVCWKHRCGTQLMQTLKLCRHHFLDNCEGCLHGEQCMSGICLNNRCGDAKSQYHRRCYGLPKPNCEVCGSHKDCASGLCERNVCVGRSGWDECKIQLLW